MDVRHSGPLWTIRSSALAGVVGTTSCFLNCPAACPVFASPRSASGEPAYGRLVHGDAKTRSGRNQPYTVYRIVEVGRDRPAQWVVADPVLHDSEVRDGCRALEAGREVHS